MTRPHLLHIFSTFAAGGPQVRTADIINGLGDRYRHTIVAMDRNFECAERVRANDLVQYRDPPSLRSTLTAPSQLARMIRDIGPDLVLSYNWGAIESIPGARLAGVRAVIHAEDGFGPEEARQMLRRRVWTRRLLYPLVSCVVVPSRRLEGIVQKRFGASRGRTLYIPNGIDTDHFAPGDGSSLREQWGIQAHERVVGTVAKLRKEKGLELLLDAFAAIRAGRPVRLVIVGDGDQRGALQEYAERAGLGGAVVFAGTLTDPRDAYRAFDLFALSSHTEQMPISLVEAMGCGLAVLSTDVGDVLGMVSAANRNRILAGRDLQVYAGALATLLDDDEQRSGLGLANRQRCVDQFQRLQMLHRYAELYEAVRARRMIPVTV